MRLLFTLRQWLQTPQPFRTRKARDVDIVRLALEAIEMDDHAPELEFDQARARELVIDRAVTPVHLSHERPLQRLVRDAVVDHVHDAADGVRSIKQRGRSAHHIDRLNRERLGGDSVIRADGGGVDRRDAILQDTNAIFTQTADDRAARARREIGRADARFAIQGFADGRFESELQLFTAQDGDGLGLLK